MTPYGLAPLPNDSVAVLRLLTLVIALTVVIVPSVHAVIYVKADATGAGNGTSWIDAYTDLQSTLSITVPGDTLWVAAGTYTPTPVLARGVSFWIRQGVVMCGGFAGTETLLQQRDIDANPTILSGEIGDPGPDDNSYHVLVSGGSDSTGVIDGFVVTGGNADYDAAIRGGGGMVINGGDSPTLVNVTFRENLAIVGGAMYIVEGSSPALVAVKFIDNTATGNISSGGAIRIDESTPTFRNAWFSGNTARLGGGMYVRGESNVTLVNTVFYDNIATDDGGTEGWGGGIYMSNSYMTITNATFANNWADVDGGGILNGEHGITTTVSLANSIFWGNLAGTSGNQIANRGTVITTIDHSLIEDCGASGLNWDSSLGVDGGDNIEAEPFFVDRTNGNLRLLFGSPAMEAGRNSAPNLPVTDLDGKPRIIGPVVDMGPYETTPICPPANVVYVNEAATGDADGTSWTDAFTDLVIALRVLDLCPGVDEIWVAAGSYDPAISDRPDETFELRNGLSLYGGFDGTESQVSQRDILANPAVLTGEIGGPNITDNIFHVVTADGNDSTAVLDGFTIERGNAAAAALAHGGGMIALGSSPTIRNIIFVENEGAWGGGFYADGGAPRLTDVVFENNTGATTGGGAAVTNTTGALFVNARFENNSAWMGGGFYVQAGSAVLVNPVFAGNLAVYYGGGIHCSAATMTITNGTFYDNTGLYGGALGCNHSAPVVTNTIMWGNSGAEVYILTTGSPVVSYSIVEGSGGSGAGWDPLLGVDGGNNLDTDPLFTDAPGGNLRLTQASPAVDAGDNAAPYLSDTDHDGGPRILHGIVDIGAYEEDTGTAIGDHHHGPALLAEPAVRSVSPNPFNPTLSVEVELDRQRHLRIEIYTVRGERVRLVENEVRSRGLHRFVWDGTDDAGHRVASGIYLLRFVSEGWDAHRKAVLLK